MEVKMAKNGMSLLIPIYNEENSIQNLFDQLHEFLNDTKYVNEIIIINDGSSDSTLQMIQFNLKKIKSKVKIINNPLNLGYGASLKRGILVSVNDYIAIIDADLTYDVYAVARMYEDSINENLDMAVAARIGKYYEGNFGKKILRRILRTIVEYMTGQIIPDINSGLRIFKRSIALRYLPLLSNHFSFTTSLTLVTMLNGGIVKYVPTSYQRRRGTTKVKLLRDSIRTLGQILAVSFFFNPLRVIYPSIFLLMFGLLATLVGVILHNVSVLIPFGLVCLILILLLLGFQSQMMSLGQQIKVGYDNNA
jgi:glycosyltransferase involved in cell wall biosynthesis